MKPIRLSIVFALFALLFRTTTFAQTPTNTQKPFTVPADLQARVDAYMDVYMKAGQFSGVIMIAHDGKPDVLKAYGYANYNKKTPNTTDTKFCLASVTKQFTAAAIMLLQERGKLHVEDKLSAYLSGCPPAWQEVTLRHLLTHTSGIPTELVETWANSYQSSPQQALALTLRKAQKSKLESDPGAQFKYNNFGYVLLSAVVEKASGKPWAAFLKEEIFTPLGMTNTGITDGKPVEGLAFGHTYEKGHPEAYDGNGWDTHGASGVYSTATDLLKWDQALYSDRLLPAAARQAIFTPYKEAFGYGYGWEIDTLNGHRRYFHTGSIGTFLSEIDRFPDEGLCVVVLCNYGFVEEFRFAQDLAMLAYGGKATAPTFVHIPKVMLDRYIGYYKTGDLRFSVLRLGDNLAIQSPRGVTVPLRAYSTTSFGYGEVIHCDFTLDKQGVPQILKVQENSAKWQAKKLPLPAIDYSPLVGAYRVSGNGDNVTLRIRRDHDKMMIETEKNEWSRLYPLSATEFFLPDALPSDVMFVTIKQDKKDKKLHMGWSAEGKVLASGVKIR